jgi:hypothetical protein
MARFLSRLTKVLGCSAAVLGCSSAVDSGRDDDATWTQSQEVTTLHHVVLLSGGFGSCDPDGVEGVLPTEANALLADIEAKSGDAPTVVRTCFGGVGDKERFDSWITRGSVTLGGGPTTLDDLESDLQDLLDAHKPSRLDAYGHSHGGWLVGRVVEDLGPGDADSFTLNLIMSDPISRVYCTPAVVITGFGRAEYCGRFPLDLDPGAIRANVHGYFGLAYQTDDWLHSSPAYGAENIFFDPGQPVRPRAFNHRALYTLPLTWGGFTHRLQYK